MPRKELRLDKLIWRHNPYDCDRCEILKGGGDYIPCLEDRLLSNGPEARRLSPAMLGAFRKGEQAWKDGASFYANSYSGESPRSDRRGRYNAGFRPVFAKCWSVGWAWAEYHDDGEYVLRVLADFAERMPATMGLSHS